jgi:acetyltransferase EpsM
LNRDIVICGAGGHGKVVADIIMKASPSCKLLGFLDDTPELTGREVLDVPVIGVIQGDLKELVGGCDFIIAIGSNEAREAVAGEAARSGATFAVALHPSAQVGTGVSIGRGTVVMANAVINPGVCIGTHVIVNTAATVDHDCVVEDFVHISPGVHLAGEVKVGRGAHIGIGASVIPGVKIGEWAVVGAGATVIEDVPAGATVVGTPARDIRRKVSAK